MYVCVCVCVCIYVHVCIYIISSVCVCQQHLVETGSFRSERTGEVFTIRHKMTCDSSNIVYLLYCDTCRHTQYIGETKNSLRTRFYQHRSNINTNTGTHVTRHFNSQLQTCVCVCVCVCEQPLLHTPFFFGHWG